MPRRTKAERQQRRQEIVRNVRSFVDRHDDKVLPLVKAVIAKKFPVASMIIEAIQEAKESKLPADTKSVTVEHLQELLELAEDDEEAARSGLINSTLVSKFISPINLVMASITFYGAMATEIAWYWGFVQKPVDQMVLITLAGIYGSMHGVHILQRGEIKKKAIETS